jgi:CheY-like chemotaxis protein
MAKTEKPCVLVVDDNEATATLLRAVLQPHFTIDIAMDGDVALEKLRTNEYAATLLDLRMPTVDGFSVLEFLKSSRPQSLRTVLVVTAMLGKQELARVRTYDVAGIIAKPFEIDALLAAVQQCVGEERGPTLPNVFCAPAILLLADLLRQRLM